MINTLRQIIEQAIEHLSIGLQAYLPLLLAGITILLVAYVVANFVRWLLTRIIRGVTFDRFLHQSGISSMFDRTGHLRATKLVAGTAYWIILGIGVLTALSAFNTLITTRMVETAVFLFPKLVTAGLILLAGAWLAQYLGRSVLVWGVNEGFPFSRKLAAATRIVIMFVAVVVAADHLDFARSVFLAAFVILVGGAVLASSLAFGLGARSWVQRTLQESAPKQGEEQAERSVWHHL